MMILDIFIEKLKKKNILLEKGRNDSSTVVGVDRLKKLYE